MKISATGDKKPNATTLAKVIQPAKEESIFAKIINGKCHLSSAQTRKIGLFGISFCAGTIAAVNKLPLAKHPQVAALIGAAALFAGAIGLILTVIPNENFIEKEIAKAMKHEKDELHKYIAKTEPQKDKKEISKEKKEEKITHNQKDTPKGPELVNATDYKELGINFSKN